MLEGLASGQIRSPTTASTVLAAETHLHLHNMLEHHCLLPPRDEHLARFESWLAAKLEAIPRRAVRDKGWTKVVLHPAKV